VQKALVLIAMAILVPMNLSAENDLVIAFSRTVTFNPGIDYSQSYNFTGNKTDYREFIIPVNSSRTINVNFLKFSRKISREEILRRLQKLDFRPVTFIEILALGIEYPEIQDPLILLSEGKVVLSGKERMFSVPFMFQHVDARDETKFNRTVNYLPISEKVNWANYYVLAISKRSWEQITLRK